ncbi:MAG: hypothetical protein IPG00_01070 [Saprospiraceae bacterium]|nr:hypothetical protein [Saprospiraceae bacterium]
MSENIAKYNVILELLADTKGIDKTKQSVGGLEKTFNLARNAFGGIIAGAVVQQQVGKIFEITKKYQQYNTILKVATGSQQEATKALQLIENAAAETVFSVDELTSSYIKFANRGMKPTRDEIISLADLAASQGKSFDQLTEAVLDASTGEFERLKEFGIKASKEGDKVKLSFKGVNQTIENTPEAINKAVISLGKLQGVAGSNAKQMKDLSGIISNIGDNTQKVYKNIGERLKGFFTESLGAVAKWVEKLVEFTQIPVSEKLQEEQIELNGLVQSITQTNISQEKRNGLIAELQEKYPFFLKNIDAETASNDQLKARLREVNELYIKRIALQGQEEKIEKALKASGEAKSKQLEIERKRRIELNKVVADLKLPIDLNSIDDLDKQTNAVVASLNKLFTVTFSKRDGEPIVQGSIKAYNALERLNNQFFAANGAASRYTNTLKELEGEQDALKDFEKSLGTDLATINKLFDVAPTNTTTTTTKPTGGGSKGKQDDPIKAAKEAEQKRLDVTLQYIEKNFAIREKEKRDTIKDAKVLAFELEKIEAAKQIAILRVKADYTNPFENEKIKKGPLADETEFIKLGNLIDQAVKEYDILESSIRKVDILQILPTQQKDIVVSNAKEIEGALVALAAQILSTNAPKLKEGFEKQFQSIAASIQQIGSKELNKLTFETGGFDAIDLDKLLPEDRVPALQNRLNLVVGAVDDLKAKLKAGLGDPLDLEAFDSLQNEGEKIIEYLEKLGFEIPEAIKKILSGIKKDKKQSLFQNILGLSDEEFEKFQKDIKFAGDLAKDSINQILESEIEAADKKIEAQESRVKDAEKIAEKGNVKQLEIEEERLAKLQEKREKFVEAQRVLAQLQILQANAVAAAEAIKAISIGFGSGPAGIITGIATGIALAASIASIVSTVRNSFSDIPAFIEGIQQVDQDPRFAKYRKHSGQDGYTARFDGKERIVDPITNSKLNGFPNALLPEAVKLYQMKSSAVPGLIAVNGKGNDAAVINELKGLKESIEAIKLDVKIDQKGIFVRWRKMFMKEEQRKRMMM